MPRVIRSIILFCYEWENTCSKACGTADARQTQKCSSLKSSYKLQIVNNGFTKNSHTFQFKSLSLYPFTTENERCRKNPRETLNRSFLFHTLLHKFAILETRRCSVHIENISMCHLYFITVSIHTSSTSTQLHERISSSWNILSNYRWWGRYRHIAHIVNRVPKLSLWTVLTHFIPHFECNTFLFTQ